MESKPKCYLLVHNIQKNKNIGMIIRSACAFNVQKIFTVIRTTEKKELKFSQMRRHFQMFGNQNTGSQMEFHNFSSLDEAKKYFIDNSITVCGVEIDETARSIVEHPFVGDTVFILGNEGQGLIDVHKQICDQFVYIPQYTNKTASLNVAVAGSIIFHHYAVWAQYQESQIFGEKYQQVQEKVVESDRQQIQKQMKIE